jgi:hypothetical protein
MTNVTFIGQAPTKESKHIELVRQYLGNDCINTPNDWQNVQLIKRNAVDGLDLIFCYHNNKNEMMYLGHWNDGTTSNKETVCTVLGKDVAVKKGKGIEFVKAITTGKDKPNVFDSQKTPSDFENVLVIRHGCASYYDEFYAYDDNINAGMLYLGHLNDGFVE